MRGREIRNRNLEIRDRFEIRMGRSVKQERPSIESSDFTLYTPRKTPSGVSTACRAKQSQFPGPRLPRRCATRNDRSRRRARCAKQSQLSEPGGPRRWTCWAKQSQFAGSRLEAAGRKELPAPCKTKPISWKPDACWEPVRVVVAWARRAQQKRGRKIGKIGRDQEDESDASHCCGRKAYRSYNSRRQVRMLPL